MRQPNRTIFVLATLAAGCTRSAAPDPTPAPSSASGALQAPAASSAAVASAAQAEPPPSAAVSASPAPSAVASAAVAPPAKSGKSAALKPAAAQVAGSNFTVDVASPGCLAGSDCVMTLKLGAGNGFHVNKEYPYKFIGAPAGGVTFLGKPDANTFGRASGDFVEQGEKAALLTVHFKAASAGDAHVTGKYKLSVCSADKCQIEQPAIDLTVPVL
jgi:hypothetical protein